MAKRAAEIATIEGRMLEPSISTRAAVFLLAGVLIVAALFFVGGSWFGDRGNTAPIESPASSTPPVPTPAQTTQAIEMLSAPRATEVSTSTTVSPQEQKTLNNLSAPSGGSQTSSSASSSGSSESQQQILRTLQTH